MIRDVPILALPDSRATRRRRVRHWSRDILGDRSRFCAYLSLFLMIGFGFIGSGRGSPTEIRRNYREKSRYYAYSILPAELTETQRSVRESSITGETTWIWLSRYQGSEQADRPNSALARVPVGCNARHRQLIVPWHISPISTEQSENTNVAPTAPITWMVRLNNAGELSLALKSKVKFRPLAASADNPSIRAPGPTTATPVQTPSPSHDANPRSLSQYLGSTEIRPFIFLIPCRQYCLALH